MFLLYNCICLFCQNFKYADCFSHFFYFQATGRQLHDSESAPHSVQRSAGSRPEEPLQPGGAPDEVQTATAVAALRPHDVRHQPETKFPRANATSAGRAEQAEEAETGRRGQGKRGRWEAQEIAAAAEDPDDFGAGVVAAADQQRPAAAANHEQDAAVASAVRFSVFPAADQLVCGWQLAGDELARGIHHQELGHLPADSDGEFPFSKQRFSFDEPNRGADGRRQFDVEQHFGSFPIKIEFL